MRKLLSVAALCGALALGACASGGTTGGLPASASTDPTIAAVQDAAAKVCNFVPTVTTVTGIIASFFPAGGAINTIASSVANAICTAIAPKKTLRRATGDGPPSVAGVKIEGYFIR